jgi:hypothetical protein
MPIIYGFLERITYHNEENYFVVAKLQEKGKRELILLGSTTRQASMPLTVSSCRSEGDYRC